MIIVNVPIEPIEMRYSADWNKWFIAELNARSVNNFSTVMGAPLSPGIREGAFLDIIGTHKFKADQVSQICSAVDQGFIPRNERVVFIIQDGWFPVEQLAYMRDMLGCHEWKFVGLFHAGTYDRWDQTAQHGMYTWGEDLENAWFKIYDRVIVASDYHRDLLLRTRKVDSSGLYVVPWKVEVPQDLVNVTKANQIVFPHRFNIEKQPVNFVHLKIPEGWRTKHTASVWAKTKREYYEVLAESKICVSFSLQETFGIAMVEAVLLGCIPLVPDRLSYKEMYPDEYRYNGEMDFKKKLNTMCSHDAVYRAGLETLQDKFKQSSSDFFNNLFSIVEDL
jgi:hypothetical protein